jgi:hypothetical protein
LAPPGAPNFQTATGIHFRTLTFLSLDLPTLLDALIDDALPFPLSLIVKITLHRTFFFEIKSSTPAFMLQYLCIVC